MKPRKNRKSKAAPSARIRQFQERQKNEIPLVLDDQGPGLDKNALARLYDFSEARLPFGKDPSSTLWTKLGEAVLELDRIEGLIGQQRDGGIDAAYARSLQTHARALRDFKSDITNILVTRMVRPQAITEFCTRVLDDKKSADLRAARGTDDTTVGAAKPQQEQSAEDRKSFIVPLLREKGWSNLRFAKEARVDFKTIRDYVRGTKNPNAATRQQMADALKIKVQDLPK